MRHLARTKPFVGRDGKVVPGSLAEVAYLQLGGLQQWVMVRGEDVSNPPLITLHGGPGFPDTAFFRRFNAPLEKDFTVVYWEQRGTGKSFDPTIPRSSMTVEQFLNDLDELVDVVRLRLGHEKVVIFGHSWGSGLGVLYAARFPEKVSAYVGSGQYGNAADGESASYAYAISEAERRGEWKIVRKLRNIGPPPYPACSLWTERLCVNRLDGNLGPKFMFQTARIFLGSPEFSLLDVPDLMRGFRFSIDAMWEETAQIDLITAVPVLEMPVFFFLGARDHWVPPGSSLAYYDVLKAPSKRLVMFEESGHEPFADEGPKFNRSMTELVRPVVSEKAQVRATG